MSKKKKLKKLKRQIRALREGNAALASLTRYGTVVTLMLKKPATNDIRTSEDFPPACFTLRDYAEASNNPEVRKQAEQLIAYGQQVERPPQGAGAMTLNDCAKAAVDDVFKANSVPIPISDLHLDGKRLSEALMPHLKEHPEEE